MFFNQELEKMRTNGFYSHALQKSSLSRICFLGIGNIHPSENKTCLYLMKAGFLLFPILVFIGGCCYGPGAGIVKLAYEAGFSPSEVFVGQYFYGFLAALLLTLISLAVLAVRKKKITFHRLSGKTVVKLIICGICCALLTICYYYSLERLPAHIAIVLLFQYAWMGVFVETIMKRKLPDRYQFLSVVIVFVATLFATGFIGGDLGSLDVLGIVFGLISAACFAIYIAILGSITSDDMMPVTRSVHVVFFGLIAMLLLFGPSLFTSGTAVNPGFMPFVLILAFTASALPNFLFAIATPKVSTGAATILSSSELPASVICSFFILSEVVSLSQWIGIGFMFFGIALPYVAEFIRRKKHPEDFS